MDFILAITAGCAIAVALYKISLAIGEFLLSEEESE